MAKQFRRLASEHASLNSSPPPDYILPESNHDDLTILDAILVGPMGTPFEAGVFRLTIKCTDTYPNTPPTANFKTKIWHPNVDEKSGEVCVDTLKTGWTPATTMRNILEVIRSLMIHPNPSSALNSEAGLLAEEDYKAFSRQAKLMTKIYASVPADLKAEVKAIRQKADEEGRSNNAAVAAAATPVAKHRKSASASSVRRPSSASSGKRTFDAMNEQPQSLSIPPTNASNVDNALHTPTKDNFANPHSKTPSHNNLKDSASSTRTGKENTRSGVSPCRSRSASPLGKRTFDEANEEGSLETNIRGEVDRSMSPPPAKRRSLEAGREATGLMMGVEIEAEQSSDEEARSVRIKARVKKVPKSVVYSKGLRGKITAPRGLKRL